MRVAYTTTFDARDVHNWSGTPFHMSKALADSGMPIEYIGSLKRKLPPLFKAKQTIKKYLCDQRESPRFNCFAAKHYSDQVSALLKNSFADVVLSPLINPIAYLDCEQPIVLWTDALYAALLGFYPPFAYHSASSVLQGNEITSQCLSRVKLAIFSSDWAANSALELYGASREKVKVVNYGANIETYPTFSEIKDIIKNRASNKIKLLFLAKSWERKGGDIVLAVAKALHESGHPVELSIVGYTPDIPSNLPYAKCLGFISKQKPVGKARLYQLLCNSHFLFVPSRADACPMVFAEANAFGLPALSTYVGGISTAVRDNVNGMTFGLAAEVKVYCDYIVNLMQDRARAMSHWHCLLITNMKRLNWSAATKQVKQLLRKCSPDETLFVSSGVQTNPHDRIPPPQHVKALSWRIFGTLVTMIFTFIIITKSASLYIGLFEFVSRCFCFICMNDCGAGFCLVNRTNLSLNQCIINFLASMLCVIKFHRANMIPA